MRGAGIGGKGGSVDWLVRIFGILGGVWMAGGWEGGGRSWSTQVSPLGIRLEVRDRMGLKRIWRLRCSE